MSRHTQTGLSLVELMIAMLLGSLLVIGLLKIFEASRASYKLSEAIARVQENGRFAMDYLQRDLRMAGHMGCASDQTRFVPAQPRFSTTFLAAPRPTQAQLATTPEALRFDLMLQGFEAEGTGPKARVVLPAAGAWSGEPALPGYFSMLSPAPVAGSDLVALRYFSPEGVPVKAFDGATITVDADKWSKVMLAGYPDAGGAGPGLLGIADCANATALAATAIKKNGGDMQISVAVGGLNKSGLSNSAFSLGQTMLYRLEMQVYYVGIDPGSGQPTLYRARFGAAPGANAIGLIGATGTVGAGGAIVGGGGASEPVAEGIEAMQLIYGQDSQTDGAVAPSGFVSTQAVASKVQTGSDTAPWRRVGLVQVALLSRSRDGAGVSSQIGRESPRLLGVETAVPADQRFRAVYESTVALRNRLYGN